MAQASAHIQCLGSAAVIELALRPGSADPGLKCSNAFVHRTFKPSQNGGSRRHSGTLKNHFDGRDEIVEFDTIHRGADR